LNRQIKSLRWLLSYSRGYCGVDEARIMSANWHLTENFSFEDQSVAFGIQGSGEPIVLIHGTPFSSYVWRSIARQLAADRRVFVYDLLGYGQSEKRAGQDVSLGVQNRLLAALLSFCGLERPKVIAHDFGGATALRAHLLDGCDYDRLLLLDPVALRPWGSPFVRHVRYHEAAFAGMPEAMHRAVLQEYLRGAIHRPLADTEIEPYLAPWLGPVGQPAFYRQIAQMDERFTDEVEGRYGEVRCPVRLLWGTTDRWIPLERGRALAERIPGCQLVEVPDCGHLMQEDAPEAIVAAALRFFSNEAV
jgi:pimeloyl-ACP methyl ester carboxylesterase